MKGPLLLAAGLATLSSLCVAQTFQRLGACPQLGCIFPPDQTDFLPGQVFDIRLEVHSPVNGSEARQGGPDPNFTFTISRKDGKGGKKGGPQSAEDFFKVKKPELERWNFTWYEDLFAQDAGTPSLVQVTSKAYRHIALTQPGEYEAVLTYYDGTTTTANWLVRDAGHRKAKNVIMFIADGMTTNMITAARLIAHKSVNGRYQTTMAMDKFPVLGHQMTHSIDTFITDSANSASALYTGHKTSVNALNVYVDSSKDPFDDPKFETIVEILRRERPESAIGIVSTALLADATPAGLTAHTRDRYQYQHVIDTYYHGLENYTWTKFDGPDVLFGGGAEQFLPKGSYKGQDYYDLFSKNGYSLSWNNTALSQAPNDRRALGVFRTSNMDKWLDRHVYTDNIKGKTHPDGSDRTATDQPGLKEMTLKAIDILSTRTKKKKDGFFLMSEAAHVDKMMHVLDYDRALGELLEFDDTIKATIEKLKEMGELDDTLIVVTADHGHGFDVMGSVDTKYLNEKEDDRQKRRAVGIYENSGLSEYTLETETSLRYNEGVHFPATWDPRYTLYQGLSAYPDNREDYQVKKDGPREPAVELTEDSGDNYANPKDAPSGFVTNGTLPVDSAQGVHSLTDVPVFAMGPCQGDFGGVYNSIDVFFKIAYCLGLGRKA